MSSPVSKLLLMNSSRDGNKFYLRLYQYQSCHYFHHQSEPICEDNFLLTSVSPSSGQIKLTSSSSPTDLPRIFKNKYSISKVGSIYFNALSSHIL